MAIAASEIFVYRQAWIENLKLAQSLDLMVWIQFTGLCRSESLGLEHGFFGPNSLCVGIIGDDALKVKSLTSQYTLLV
jgi:hypothetical protein